MAPSPAAEALLPLLRPPALNSDSTIGLVAPASGLSRRSLDEAVSSLRGMGFDVELGSHLARTHAYLSATDAERAADFMEMIGRPDIDCIMCVRGGYGTMRILPLLDYRAIRANPKIIVGYSDITALVLAISRHSRIVTFHGPVACSTFSPFTLTQFRRMLGGEATVEIDDMPPLERHTALDAKSPLPIVTLAKGKATGRLVGGNLATIAATLGTPYEIDTTGAILFLEEITEEPYHIDRMLTQLWLSGKLAACAGIALGRFKNCESHGNIPATVPLSLAEIVRSRISSLGIPAVYGMPIGHVKDKLTVPIGVRATLDADRGSLALLEPAVM
jgi:muramoyltetrapeptide carboxypeptidase